MGYWDLSEEQRVADVKRIVRTSLSREEIERRLREIGYQYPIGFWRRDGTLHITIYAPGYNFSV